MSVTSGQGEKKKGFSLAAVATVVSVVTSALVAYNTYLVNQFETAFKQQQSDREFNLQITEYVLDALKSGDWEHQRAVRNIVEAMAPQQTRPGFLKALEKGQVEIYQKEQAETVAQALVKGRTAPPQPVRVEQPIGGTPSPPVGEGFDWEDWDYDIFWCESSGPTAQAQSKALVEALTQDGAQGRLRSRLLPDSVRAKAGLANVRGYAVHAEANEIPQAEAVKRLAEEVLEMPGQFNINRIAPKQKTPWYVSVFICPEPSTVD